MNNLIVITLGGIYDIDTLEAIRKKKLEEIKEGLIVIDETVKGIESYSIDELGVDIKNN